MRILFDHQVFGFQRYGGISRYFTELLRRFQGGENVQADLSLVLSENRHLRELSGRRIATLLGDRRFKGKHHLMEAVNRFQSRRRLGGADYDLFHPTYYHPYFLPLLKGRPFVLTVYDMIHELFPDKFPAGAKVPLHKRLTIPKASRIIAISENTKADILRFFPMDPDRIQVIHLGATMPHPDPAAAGRLALPGEYLLFAGDRRGYKNFLPFLGAAAPVFRRHPALHLVCVGGGDFQPEERRALAEAGLSGRTRRLDLTDRELALAYREAKAFVYPSLYEGFGIPILEAFACGCPVILSRTSSFPEIAGDAAAYFDPGTPGMLTDTLAAVLEDNALRCGLAAKGRERLRLFSWDETAAKTRTVYRSVLS